MGRVKPEESLESRRAVAVDRWSDLAWSIINLLEPSSVGSVGEICLLIEAAFKAANEESKKEPK